jgi:hypothetical protein
MSPVAMRAASASKVKARSRSSSGPPPWSRRSSAGRFSMPRSVATTPPCGSESCRSTSRTPVALAKSRSSASSPPGPSRRPGEVGRAVGRELRLLADGGGGEVDAREVELGDAHGERKLGQAEGLRLGRGQPVGDARLGRDRPAGEVDALDGEAVDVEAATQEGEAGPVDLDAGERQPDAFVVGDGQRGDARLRRERAAHPVQPDHAPGAGDSVLDEVDDEAVVVLVRGGDVLSHRGHGQDDEQAEEGEKPSQNACPMPM